MMLDLFSDGEPSALWTTDFNGEGAEAMCISLGPLELSISQPGASAVEGVGTGALVWQAGPALAQALVLSGGGCLRDVLVSARAIELGCGCSALPGIALALAGATEVNVTDGAAVLSELQPNLAAYNAASAAAASASPSPDNARPPLESVVIPRILDWDDGAALAELASNPFPLVVAADCDYADTLHGALLDAVSAALAPSTTSAVLFASAARCQRTLRLFLKRVKECSLDVVELSASLDPLPDGETGPQDGVRFFLARWRSEADARASRKRWAASSDERE